MIRLTRAQQDTLARLVTERDTWANVFEADTLAALVRRGLAVVEEAGFPPRRLAVATDLGRAVYRERTTRSQCLREERAAHEALDRELLVRRILGRYVREAYENGK